VRGEGGDGGGDRREREVRQNGVGEVGNCKGRRKVGGSERGSGWGEGVE